MQQGILGGMSYGHLFHKEAANVLSKMRGLGDEVNLGLSLASQNFNPAIRGKDFLAVRSSLYKENLGKGMKRVDAYRSAKDQADNMFAKGNVSVKDDPYAKAMAFDKSNEAFISGNRRGSLSVERSADAAYSRVFENIQDGIESGKIVIPDVLVRPQVVYDTGTKQFVRGAGNEGRYTFTEGPGSFQKMVAAADDRISGDEQIMRQLSLEGSSSYQAALSMIHALLPGAVKSKKYGIEGAYTIARNPNPLIGNILNREMSGVEAIHERAEALDLIRRNANTMSSFVSPITGTNTYFNQGMHSSPDVLFAEREYLSKLPEHIYPTIRKQRNMSNEYSTIGRSPFMFAPNGTPVYKTDAVNNSTRYLNPDNVLLL